MPIDPYGDPDENLKIALNRRHFLDHFELRDYLEMWFFGQLSDQGLLDQMKALKGDAERNTELALQHMKEERDAYEEHG